MRCSSQQRSGSFPLTAYDFVRPALPCQIQFISVDHIIARSAGRVLGTFPVRSIVHGHARARSSQGSRDPGAYPYRSARHDCNFIRQSAHIHDCSWPVSRPPNRPSLAEKFGSARMESSTYALCAKVRFHGASISDFAIWAESSATRTLSQRAATDGNRHSANRAGSLLSPTSRMLSSSHAIQTGRPPEPPPCVMGYRGQRQSLTSLFPPVPQQFSPSAVHQVTQLAQRHYRPGRLDNSPCISRRLCECTSPSRLAHRKRTTGQFHTRK
jgi:hypothetical protein